MSHARGTTLTFFVTYLLPLKLKAYAAKIDFFFFTFAGRSVLVVNFFFPLMLVVALLSEPLLYTYQ